MRERGGLGPGGSACLGGGVRAGCGIPRGGVPRGGVPGSGADVVVVGASRRGAFRRGAARPHGVRRQRGAASRWAVALLALVALVGAPLAVRSAVASVGQYRCVDATRVYLGNARLFQSPCHVESDTVYRRIAEYREILDRGLTDNDVQYHFLMKKAAKQFNAAIKAMSTSYDHDLVAEAGSVVKARDDAPDVPDRTAEAIAALQ